MFFLFPGILSVKSLSNIQKPSIKYFSPNTVVRLGVYANNTMIFSRRSALLLPAHSIRSYPITGTHYRLLTRNYLVLDPLLKETRPDASKHIDLMNELIVSAYQYLLFDCLSTKSTDEASIQQYTDRMRQYLTFIIRSGTAP